MNKKKKRNEPRKKKMEGRNMYGTLLNHKGTDQRRGKTLQGGGTKAFDSAGGGVLDKNIAKRLPKNRANFRGKNWGKGEVAGTSWGG